MVFHPCTALERNHHRSRRRERDGSEALRWWKYSSFFWEFQVEGMFFKNHYFFVSICRFFIFFQTKSAIPPPRAARHRKVTSSFWRLCDNRVEEGEAILSIPGAPTIKNTGQSQQSCRSALPHFIKYRQPAVSLLSLADRTCRTCICTGTAIYACTGVDDIMIFTLGNSTIRALSLTGTAAYTIITDNICHSLVLLRTWIKSTLTCTNAQKSFFMKTVYYSFHEKSSIIQ